MLAAVAWLIRTGTAAARQAPDVSPVAARADVHAVIGWQNLRQDRGATRYRATTTGSTASSTAAPAPAGTGPST